MAKKKSQNNKLITILVITMAVLGLALIVLLTQTTSNRLRYETSYTQLLILNAVVVAGLLIAVLWSMVAMWRRLRQSKFGSKLLIKLAGIFTLVGVVPSVLVYLVSYQFVSRSIESWFDVQVESALSAGVQIGQSMLDSAQNELERKTRRAAAIITEQETSLNSASAQVQAGAISASDLKPMLSNLDVASITLWQGERSITQNLTSKDAVWQQSAPPSDMLDEARTKGVANKIEGLDGGMNDGAPQAKIQVLLPLPKVQKPQGQQALEPRYIMLSQPLDSSLAKNALTVQAAYRDYQERALAREGLKRMYIGTLSLVLALAAFLAIFMAYILGRQLVKPLLLLAKGVEQVAQGDLRPKQFVDNKDELGGLTKSFAQMTQQLSEARDEAQRSMGLLDASRNHVQTILDNLTAGVVVLDMQGRVQSSNPSATRILRLPMASLVGHALYEIPSLEKFGAVVEQAFADSQADAHLSADHWQAAIELPLQAKALGAPVWQGAQLQESQAIMTLVARGAILSDHERLLVFDDISEVVSAQRTHAWAEVARRLAHEIKNPLTPIQLSAERLRMKLEGKLEPLEASLVEKSVRVIVEQVEAMKRLVNEFRDFGRLPVATLNPLDINALLQEVLQLYAPSEYAEFELDLDTKAKMILGDQQQIRQVIHNLLQNAQDANESARGRRILVQTRVNEKGDRLRFTVQDSGPGFSDAVLRRAFEPYVTTKPKGTGLGLAMVKKIADEHHARVEIGNISQNSTICGAKVVISFKVAV